MKQHQQHQQQQRQPPCRRDTNDSNNNNNNIIYYNKQQQGKLQFLYLLHIRSVQSRIVFLTVVWIVNTQKGNFNMRHKLQAYLNLFKNVTVTIAQKINKQFMYLFAELKGGTYHMW